MRRSVVRFERAQIDALGKLAMRCAAETGKPPRRAALVRLLVGQKLAEIDDARPIAAQLPLSELEVERLPSSRTSKEAGSTLRGRIVATMAESPAEVFTPARLAPRVRAASRDTVRNTLLVLSAQGRIEKVGPGRYRAWPQSGAPLCDVVRCAAEARP
jgi:hypothetical protein